jgi:hypothetical protein
MLNALFKKDSGVSNADLEKLRAKLSEVAGSPSAGGAAQSSSVAGAAGQQAAQPQAGPANFQSTASSQQMPAMQPVFSQQMQQPQQYTYVDPDRAEENERITNLIMQQIRELIEIDNNLNVKIKEIEAKLSENTNGLNSVKSFIDSFSQKMDIIDKNMEKFMGLYEIVTNRFNPFIVEDEQEEVNFEKLGADKSKVQAGQKTLAGTAAAAGAVVPGGQQKKADAKSDAKPDADNLQQKAPLQQSKQAPVTPIITDSIDETSAAKAGAAGFAGGHSKLEPEQMKEIAELVAKTVNFQIRDAVSGISSSINASMGRTVNDQIAHSEQIKLIVRSVVTEELGKSATSGNILPAAAQPVVMSTAGQYNPTSASSQAEPNERQKKLPKSFHFHLPNGFLVDSRQTFIDGLKSIDEAAFANYVDATKNDFAKWIAIALKDEALADKASKISTLRDFIEFSEKNL